MAWYRSNESLIVLVVIIVVTTVLCACLKTTKVSKPSRVSSKFSSLTRDQTACKERIKILIVHHGNEEDLFWQDVEKGFQDAHNLLDGIDLNIVRGLGNMERGIYGSLGQTDGLCVTCPYVRTSQEAEYLKIDDAIKAVIQSGIPVITFNTDTYHNREVFQYVGSFNKELGKRGAVSALKKYPSLLPENKELELEPNLSTSCDERVKQLRKQCEESGTRKISHVIGMLQENFNVTLDWRIDEFFKEWCNQTMPFAPPLLIKTYSKAETLSEIEKVSKEEGCILVPCGVMVLQDCVELLTKYQATREIYACQVCDTGELVSKLAGENDIPFVGQMPYQQGFSCITSMHNIIANYNYGKNWEREKGNSAVTIEANYECIEDCVIEDKISIKMKQRDRGPETPWMQIGVAIMLEGLDIAAWDEYKEENVGRINKVILPNGNVIDVTVVNGAQNFGATYDGKSGRLYTGMLSEFIKFFPLYERRIDLKRNKFQYYIVTANGTRMPISEDIEKLRNGMFLRLQYAENTYRIQLYEQDDLKNLQKVLQGSLGNRCAPCN